MGRRKIISLMLIIAQAVLKSEAFAFHYLEGCFSPHLSIHGTKRGGKRHQSLSRALILLATCTGDKNSFFQSADESDNADDDDDDENWSSRRNGGSTARRKQQEYFMEAASSSGAKKIAQMSVMERTKRALLAEAVEDRIFSLQEDLDQLILQENRENPPLDDSSFLDDDGTATKIPVEQLQKNDVVWSQCVDLAKQIKAAQGQYRELVSGEESGLLNNVESLGKAVMRNTEKDKRKDGFIDDDGNVSK